MLAADPTSPLMRRVRSARRRPLFAAEQLPGVDVEAGAIESLLPHREPMRLVDRVRGFDPESGRAWGERRVPESDRGFDGHFPGDAVYPGVLQVEGAGQLALLAAALPKARSGPARVRLTRVIEAAFVGEVRPDTTLTMLSERVEDDGYVLTSLGQVLVGDTVVCACAFEAMWIE